VLPTADFAQLTDVVTNGNTPQKLAVRARITLMLADHVRRSFQENLPSDSSPLFGMTRGIFPLAA
jgi:hypothetical protein